MLIDSNIIIYSIRPDQSTLRQWIADQHLSISIISYIEVLGFRHLSDKDRDILQRFFDMARILPLTDPIVHNAIGLRRLHSMSLGDSIIGATALVYDLTLVTNNQSDFQRIPGLKLYDPFET